MVRFIMRPSLSGLETLPCHDQTLLLPREEARCALCGGEGPFRPVRAGASQRENRCPACASSRRTRDLVRALLALYAPAGSACLSDNLESLHSLRILELQAQGPLNARLRVLPGYCCSEFFPGLASGERSREGILCQDATRLSFADASFDLVISQDVLEHISDVWRAFAEISRVLSPGGRHLFTVPLHEGVPTRQRALAEKDGNVRHLLCPVHHKDPLNREGALVYWDFGVDLPQLLSERGIRARLAARSVFYPPEGLCRVESEAEHRRYRKYRDSGRHALFFLYNSNVFVTEKP